jgi:restriction system protein
MNDIPKSPDLIKPILLTLKEGEVLHNNEIRERVSRLLGLNAEQLKQIHSGSRTEFEYRLAWARTNAKSKGLIDSPKRMHWKITEVGKTRI